MTEQQLNELILSFFSNESKLIECSKDSTDVSLKLLKDVNNMYIKKNSDSTISMNSISSLHSNSRYYTVHDNKFINFDFFRTDKVHCGWHRFENGLIMQFGACNENRSVPFEIAFPNKCILAAVMQTHTTDGISVERITRHDFIGRVSNDTRGDATLYYIAIGV